MIYLGDSLNYLSNNHDDNYIDIIDKYAYYINIFKFEKNSNIKTQLINRLNGKKTGLSCFILPHLGLGDQINICGFVRLMSVFYDNITLVVRKNTSTNVMKLYDDLLSNIDYYLVDNDMDISPRYGCDIVKFNNIVSKYTDKYLMMSHSLDKYFIYNNIFTNIPFNFYTQFGFDSNSFWIYSKLPKSIVNIDVSNYKIIFCHNSSSNGKVYEIDHVLDKLNVIKSDYLIINPNENYYQNSYDMDKMNIAEKFINLPIFDYSGIIESAEINIFSDSSFICMAINMNLKNNNYYISRNYRDYSYIWGDSFYEKIGRKEIKQIII